MDERPSTVPRLSHLAEDGSARMVDVSAKAEEMRVATAAGFITLEAETVKLIQGNKIAKGSVLATARIAGIQAAKRTSELIPLCHSLLLQHVDVRFETRSDGISIECAVRTIGRTGAEMEALTGVSVAALTIYDMCKAVDKAMRVGQITLVSKTKHAL